MSIQHGNLGIVKNNLSLYYNGRIQQGFRGEATSNLANTISIGPQGGSLTVATSYPSFSEDLSKGNYFKNVPGGGVLYHLVTNPAFSNNAGLYNNNGGLTGATSIPIAGTYLIFSFYVYLTQIYTGYNGGLGGYINVNTNTGGNGSMGGVLTSYGWSFYVNGVLDNGWSSNTAYLNKWIRVVAIVNNGAISASAKYFSNWYIYNDRLTSGAMYIAKFQVEQKTYVTNPVVYDILTNFSNRGETTTNLITNPDFTSTSNWNNNGNVTLSITTVGAKSYLQVVSNQGSSTPGILSDAITVTASTVYTLSAYAYRSGTEAYLYVYNANNGTDIIWTSQGAAALGTTEGWVVNKFTTPVGCTSIKVGVLWASPNVNDTFYVEKMQLEQREYQSAFVSGSRTANTIASGGGLIDMSGNNNNADLTTISSFDSSGYYFNGSSDYINLGSDITFKSSGGWSVSSWFNLTQVVSGNLYNFIGASAITYNSWYWTVYQSKLALWNLSPGGWYYGSTTILANTWYNAVLVCSYDGTKYQMYLNGIAEGGTHATYTWNADYSGLKIGYVGRGDTSNGRYFYGKYPSFQVYSKALTSAEVLQNFNATRKTYGV